MQSNIYLSIPGMSGDVIASPFKYQIAVQSFSWEMAQPLDPATGQLEGSVNTPVFTIQALSGSHSPLLWKAMIANSQLATTGYVTLTVTETDAGATDAVMTYKLNNCFCGSYSPSCDIGSAGPTEVFTILAGKVQAGWSGNYVQWPTL